MWLYCHATDAAEEIIGGDNDVLKKHPGGNADGFNIDATRPAAFDRVTDDTDALALTTAGIAGAVVAKITAIMEGVVESANGDALSADKIVSVMSTNAISRIVVPAERVVEQTSHDHDVFAVADVDGVTRKVLDADVG